MGTHESRGGFMKIAALPAMYVDKRIFGTTTAAYGFCLIISAALCGWENLKSVAGWQGCYSALQGHVRFLWERLSAP